MNRAKLTLIKVLFIALLLPLSAQAQNGSIDITIEYADGTIQHSSIEGFSIGLEGEEPKAALLLPAVQAAREAARRMEKSVSKGELIPNILIQTNNEKTYYKWKLTNVMIKSYSMHGSSSDNPVPTETLTLNYERVEYSFNGMSDAFDCTSNSCKLESDSYIRTGY
ncbi:MAG: type VI secretion system tube protein Hcp [Candidatus Thiodiazotropha endolucinida]|nr:type VI secretion system tube protein Hcp [Candidatus Thiodiazotropha taylori]MCW4240911.1 type VI secretion system tube protein Hcp [Candidatus Thiodiazotropha taylori]